MTDPSVADAIYLEPLTVEAVEAVIARERPEGLLAGLGGQTALNLAIAMADAGVFERHAIRLLGTPLEAIRMAEDREAFRDLLDRIGQPYAPSRDRRGRDRRRRASARPTRRSTTIGLPAIVRPGFTLGGTGGGIVETEPAYRERVRAGLRASPIGQVMVERCLVGWQEIEYEVMRDADDTCIAVCSMENVDPLGVHTGDSIVVAPVQTLTDAVHQRLRSAALAIIRALGVEGGCNVQFALSPDSTEYAVIEVNPRVSRSSALASKATGYPIARVAAQIAVGRRLAEIPNVVTGTTVAAFEPALDYVVVKLPRFPFDKFPGADRTLGSQMKATGEVMAIDRTFGSALNKALRGLEQAGVGPLAEDPRWAPDARLPRRRLRRRSRGRRADPLDRRAGQACESTRHAQRTAAPIVLRQFLAPSDSRLWRMLGLLRRGVPEAVDRRGDRDRLLVPRRDGPQRRARGRDPGDGIAPDRRRGPGRGRAPRDGQARRLRRPGAGRPVRRRRPPTVRAARLALGLAAGLRDGRHVRRGVRGRDAVLLLAPTPPPVSAPEAPPVDAAGRAGHRLRAGPDRAGDRVRLLRRPGRRDAPRGGLARGDDQLEPGDGLDRLRRVSSRLYFEPLDPESVRSVIDAESRGRRSPCSRPSSRTAARRRSTWPRRWPPAAWRCSAPTSRRSTRRRSGPASRRCSTGSASRSRRAGWPTASRRRSRWPSGSAYPVIVRPSFVIGGLAIDFCYSPTTWPASSPLPRWSTPTGQSGSTATSRASRSTSMPSPTAGMS